MTYVRAFIRTRKKGAEVNVRFRLIDGRNVQLYHKSEIKVNADLWDDKSECIKKRALCRNSVRLRIDKEVAERKNLLLSLYEENKDRRLTSEDFECLVREYFDPSTKRVDKDSFFNGVEEFLKERKDQGKYLGVHRVLFRLLSRYEMFIQKTQDKDFHLTFESMDTDQFEDIISFIQNEHTITKEYPFVFNEIHAVMASMAGYTTSHPCDRPRSGNYMAGLFARFNCFLRWCVDKGLLSKNPTEGYKGSFTEVYGTPYYINLEERNLIADFDLSSHPYEEVHRDIFIFQCCIGCRYSDLKKLKETNVIDGAIEYIPQKTAGLRSKTIRVPLNDRAKKLIEKYKGTARGGRLFPVLGAVTYNLYIKRIFKICGVTRLVTVLNPVTRKAEQRPINEVASSHMARRCFIGNMYKKIKDPNLIASMSGHVEGSKSFARYREIDDDLKREAISLID